MALLFLCALKFKAIFVVSWLKGPFYDINLERKKYSKMM